nr:hypothetical protein Iba_chr10aCG18340 [Ipomoea batatas]
MNSNINSKNQRNNIVITIKLHMRHTTTSGSQDEFLGMKPIHHCNLYRHTLVKSDFLKHKVLKLHTHSFFSELSLELERDLIYITNNKSFISHDSLRLLDLLC